MTRHDLRNALCILHSLDRDELVEAGAIEGADQGGWAAFTQAPHKYLTSCNDAHAKALWGLIERRMPPKGPDGEPAGVA